MIPKNFYKVATFVVFFGVSCNKDKSTSNDQASVTRNGLELAALDMTGFAGKLAISENGTRGVFVASREKDQLPRVYQWTKGSDLPVSELASSSGIESGGARLPELGAYLSSAGDVVFLVTPSAQAQDRQALYTVPFGSNTTTPTLVLGDSSVVAIKDMIFSDSGSGLGAVNVTKATAKGLRESRVFLFQVSDPTKSVLLSASKGSGERALAFRENPATLVMEQISETGSRSLKTIDLTAVDYGSGALDYSSLGEALYSELSLERDPQVPLNFAGQQAYFKARSPRAAGSFSALGNASNVGTFSYPRVSHLSWVDSNGTLVSDPKQTVGTEVLALSFSKNDLVGGYIGKVPYSCRSEDGMKDLSLSFTAALVASSDGIKFNPVFIGRKTKDSPWESGSEPCAQKGYLDGVSSLSEVRVNAHGTGDAHRFVVSLFENGSGYKVLLLDKIEGGYAVSEL